MSNATREQLQLIAVNETIEKLPDADRNKVAQIHDGILELCRIYNPSDMHVALAVAKIGLELSSRNAGGLKL